MQIYHHRLPKFAYFEDSLYQRRDSYLCFVLDVIILILQRLGRVEAISGQLCRVRVMTEKEVREEAFTNVSQLNNMTMALRKTESILRAICRLIIIFSIIIGDS
jgi:hypothetical protein